MKCSLFLSFVVFCFLTGAAPLSAQDANRYTSHSLTVGAGLTNVYDSYLSPLTYHGEELRIQRETFRQTTFMHDKVYVQSLLNLHASSSKNQAKTATMYEGLLSWDLGYLYKFKLDKHLSLFAGPAVSLNGGVIYNERNSNNPAQAKASAHLSASGKAIYQFKALKKDWMLSYQVSLPLLGLNFSPEYGESYYEIFSLNHQGHHVCLTTPFNSPTLRQTLSLDFACHRTTLRVSLVGDYQQSSVNRLKSHVWSHALLLGFVKNFKLVKPGDKDFNSIPYQP